MCVGLVHVCGECSGDLDGLGFWGGGEPLGRERATSPFLGGGSLVVKLAWRPWRDDGAPRGVMGNPSSS